MFLATGLVPLGKTQLSEYGFSASAEHPRLGPVRSPWDTDHTAGASSAGSGRPGRRRRGPDRPRQRRRRLDPDPGRRSTAWSGSSRPATGSPQDRMLRQMPVRIVSDGVLTRSVRDTAAFLPRGRAGLPRPAAWRRSATSPARAARRLRGRRGHRGHRASSATPEVARADPRRPRALLEALGHHVEWIDAAGARRRSATTSCSTGRSLASVIVRTGRLAHGRSWDPARLDNLTLGPRPALPPQPAPAARRDRAGCGARGRLSAELLRDVRRRAHPDPRHARPRELGQLDPTQDYEHGDGPAAGVGGVHAAAERHRRPGRSRCRSRPPPPGCRRG